MYQGKIPKYGNRITIITQGLKVFHGKVVTVTTDGIYIRDKGEAVAWFLWEDVRDIDFILCEEELTYLLEEQRIEMALLKHRIETLESKKPQYLISCRPNLDKHFYDKMYIDTDKIQISNLPRCCGKEYFKKQLNAVYGEPKKEYAICIGATVVYLKKGDFVKIYIKDKQYNEVGVFEYADEKGVYTYDDGGRTSRTNYSSIKAIGTFRKE